MQVLYQLNQLSEPGTISMTTLYQATVDVFSSLAIFTSLVLHVFINLLLLFKGSSHQIRYAALDK